MKLHKHMIDALENRDKNETFNPSQVTYLDAYILLANSMRIRQKMVTRKEQTNVRDDQETDTNR